MRSGSAATIHSGTTPTATTCLDILKAKKVAVLGDNTGYGTTATAASVANFKKAGVEVVYDAVIDANAQDPRPICCARAAPGRRRSRSGATAPASTPA